MQYLTFNTPIICKQSYIWTALWAQQLRASYVQEVANVNTPKSGYCLLTVNVYFALKTRNWVLTSLGEENSVAQGAEGEERFAHHRVKSFSITPSVILQPKCFFGCSILFARKRDGDWITTKPIREMVLGVSVHSFILKRGRDVAILCPSTSDPIISSIQYNSKYISSGSEPLQQIHNTHKDISRDRGILDDFLIGFIPLSCH